MIKRFVVLLIEYVFALFTIPIGLLIISLEPMFSAGMMVAYIAYDLTYFGLLNRLPDKVQVIFIFLNNNGLETSIPGFTVFMSVFCILLTYPYAHKHSRGVPIFSLTSLLFLFGIGAAYTSAAGLGFASIIAQWFVIVWFGVVCVTLKKQPSKAVESTLQATLPKDYTCALCHKKSVSDPCPSCNRREIQRVRAQNLRAKQAGAPGTLTLLDWLATLKAFNYKCAYCQIADFTLLEHYIPLPYAGTTVENCVPGCRSCNAKKSNKHPEK